MVRARLAKHAHTQDLVLFEHYTLTATGLEVRGRPSFEQNENVGDFIARARSASGFWLADWLRYTESRTDWADRLDQARDKTGLAIKSLKNIRAIGAMHPDVRREGLELGIHEVVASMPRDEQMEWLERAETEGWGVRDLRRNIRAHKRTLVLEGQAVLAGLYRVIYADCPWKYGDSGPTVDGSLGKAERSYEGMTIEALCNLPVAAHCHQNAVMFFWVTAPMLYENPGPREVIEAWGFKPKTGIVWDKVLHNWGHYVGIHHEHLIIATRGSCMPDVPTPMPDSVQVVRRRDDAEHSEKPEEFRKLIEKLYTRGPYLELFGRRKVAGWDVFGNDARLWTEGAA